MKWRCRSGTGFLGLLILALASCDRGDPGQWSEPIVFTSEEVREISRLSPLPATPPNPTNAVAENPDAARLGQLLFFDQRLSANGKVSCATCHHPEHGFSDGKPLSEGLETTERHSPALWNVAHQRWFFWDGRADSLWAQSLQPLLSEKEMGGSIEMALELVSGDPGIRSAYEKVFGTLSETGRTGGPPRERFFSNLGKSFEAYQRRIISTDSPFDRFVAQLHQGGLLIPEKFAIGEAARRGLKLFVGRGQCILCHAGPNLSDGEFHNIGLPKLPDLPADKGRFTGIRKLQADQFNGLGDFSDDRGPETNIKLRYLVQKLNNLGEFKTPTLRNIADTAPYMHDGRFATLGEVLDFYSELPDEPVYGHREETLAPLHFSRREKEDLEAFLETLTGAPLDATLTMPLTDSAQVLLGIGPGN